VFNLVKYFRFWYHVPRKLWQPWFTSDNFLGTQDFLDDADNCVDWSVVHDGVADVGGAEEDDEVDEGRQQQHVLIAQG
jgi:hypothetical protein